MEGGGTKGGEIEFSKSSQNQLIFCTRGFSGMGNSNPKEFFDFDYRKVSNPVTNPENSHKMTIILKANNFLWEKPFFTSEVSKCW